MTPAKSVPRKDKVYWACPMSQGSAAERRNLVVQTEVSGEQGTIPNQGAWSHHIVTSWWEMAV